uniref:RNA-directed RNA polymerase n=1 Tax=Soybean leaf-associated ssRNA virus 1 TaxID=1719267 RepID=A0A0S1WF86_9VIRU|nr:RNA-dependent RNA polymerase [Soybean leaf-associated ssRNA virus 1]
MELRNGAKLLVPEEDTLKVDYCPGKRRMYRAYVPKEEGIWAPACYANCRDNELAALKLRTLGPTPPDPAIWPDDVLSEFKGLRVLVKVLNVDKWDIWRTARSYDGRLRRRYLEAAHSLETDGWIDRRDYKLSAFLKSEKHNPRAKIGKPRMIFPRSPRYNLVLASYLKPLEHALWKSWRFGLGVSPTRVSAKGLNSAARAELISAKMRGIGDCVVFEVDGKAFEAHVSARQLGLESSVYKAAFRGDAELASLLKVQRVLKGRTSAGVRFERSGGRASGDFNTGMGNTILMGCFVSVALRRFAFENPGVRCTLLADGDNALVFVSSRWADRLRSSFANRISSICGHEMTVEDPTDVLEKVVFGQSQPIVTSDGLKMVRDFRKVLAGAFCGHRHYFDRTFAPRLMYEVALAELSLARGVPVLEPYFRSCVQALEGFKRLRDPSLFLEGHLLGVNVEHVKRPFEAISIDTRVSFESAFGVGVQEQLDLEQRLVSGVRADLRRVATGALWLDEVVTGEDGRSGSETVDAWDHCFL